MHGMRPATKRVGFFNVQKLLKSFGQWTVHVRHHFQILPNISKISLLSTSALTCLSTSAFAQLAENQSDIIDKFGIAPTEILYFSMIIGAISATMISAIWLIRERSKVEAENVQLRAQLRQAQSINGRYQSLLSDSDQKIVIWEDQGSSAECLGNLPADLNLPTSNEQFLDFHSWMELQSAEHLQDRLEKLKSNAARFDLIVETNRGKHLEVQGRVFGPNAFIRLVPLLDIRSEKAELTTERNRLFNALETFQNLLDIIEMPVWMRSPDGKLVWVNEAFADATEAKNRQDALDSGMELLGIQARERIKAESTPERPFFDKVSTVVRGNRRIFEVADTKSPSGSAGLAIDITAEEDMRSELQDTLQSHINVVNNISIPIAIFDRDQQMQFYNQAFEDMWDLSSEFLATKPDNNAFLERLRADGKLSDQPLWHEWKADMLSAYLSMETQQNFWHLADGQTLHVVANANPQGGVIWAFENVTEKVNLETRYNRLLQVQGQTIDHLAEGVCVFGYDGNLRLINPAFRALWALAEEQSQPGTHIRDIVPECEKSYGGADGWRKFANVITSADETRLDHQGRLELNTGLILDYALVPLADGLTMVTFVNMSDSVRAERMLTEKNEALVKAESLKNDFVQHVSYELRSPLTNIIGFTDLVRTPGIGELNERQSEYLEHIATSSSVLLTIVNDILDLATVDAGIMKLDIQDVNVEELFAQTCEQVADRMKENSLSLNIDLSAAPQYMRGDEQRLRQILLKLLGNAANASSKAANVDLSCRQMQNQIIFEVKDYGAGIPQDEINKVFERFESRGKNGQRGGAGLGLSIVKSFVGLHKGHVNIESAIGEGTIVTCYLPNDLEQTVQQTGLN